MRSLLFLLICVMTTSWSYASTTKEDFISQINSKMPANLCKKMSQCYSAKAAECEQKMKAPVKKCSQAMDAVFGRNVSPEIGKASTMMISSCALRNYASENAAKLKKTDKKCEQFSVMALRY
ncbi:MAG: hypothetical protein K0R29_1743 [Pseudobdellovibrio sp.]|nr:hypothetical protein [Pseudobdellovibrio sp.]